MFSNSWKDVFVQVEMGILFEFKHRKSHKPSRVLTLSLYGIRLAQDLVGPPFSFGLFAKRKDPIFYSCQDHADLISWVTVCGKYCSDVDIEWKEDEILEALNDAVVMASKEGRIVGVNGAALNLFGCTRKELIGQKLQTLMPENLAKVHDSYIQFYLKTNQGRLMRRPRKLEALTKNREIIVVELSLGEIHDQDGKGKRKFIGRFRRVGESGNQDDEADASEGISGYVDDTIEKFTAELKTAVQGQVDQLQNQLRQAEDKVAELEAIIEHMEEDKEKNSFPTFSAKGKKNLSGSSNSCGSLEVRNSAHSVKRSKTVGQIGHDKFVLSLQNVEMDERISSDTGSGCAVFSCNVDGWQCAAKVLSLDGILESHLAKFESEVSLLEGLPAHKNLVRYLFHQQDRLTMRLFMRKYNSTLYSYLQERRQMEHPLHPEELVNIGLDLVLGLDVLHKHHIIHRDLKPANTFVTLDGIRRLQCCSIGDMDSAKILMYGQRAVTVLGTPGYMAPEVLSGTREYSYPVDVWGLGIILYECLVNATKEGAIYDTSTGQEKITKTGQLPFEVDPKLEGFAKIICRCLRKSPKRRPTSEALKNEFLQLRYSSLL